MKKTLLVSLTVLFLLLLISSFFISDTIIIAGSQPLPVPATAAQRGINKTREWKQWWPMTPATDSSYSYNQLRFHRLLPELTSVRFLLQEDDREHEGAFVINTGKGDSSAIHYEVSLVNTHKNPISRIRHFFNAFSLKSSMDALLLKAAAFYANPDNIYGIHIINTWVKDSTLISTKMIKTDTPSIGDVYALIDKLNSYIQKNKGTIRNAPMLNITRLEANQVQAMVAIPLLRDIPATGDIVIKKMVLGKILETEITGDENAVWKGRQELKNYADDYLKLSPAIPFESLLTNRLQEKDKSRWKTRLSYPIF